MMKTYAEQLQELGACIRARRKGLGLTQQAAAERSGVNYRTWRRLEGMGQASIEDLVRAAVALRCEGGLEGLFPAQTAANLDELLRQQKAQARRSGRMRT